MKLLVLHVDDESDIRRLVQLSLGLDPDIAVHSCACGADAVMVAEEWMPDLILCDVMMPGMDGPATLARLRECPRTAKIPVVFMTARVQSREVERFRSLGADGVIVKPFIATELADLVRACLRAAGHAVESAEQRGKT
ncbi:MAG TPA: response regulator [Xanthobacteraceae bacterium]|jgi:CheY-like chemotaxis protein